MDKKKNILDSLVIIVMASMCIIGCTALLFLRPHSVDSYNQNTEYMSDRYPEERLILLSH